MPPKNWPSDVEYLNSYCYHSGISKQTRDLIGANTGQELPPGKRLCVIQRIVDPNHPAYRQCGLFAAKKIAPNCHIVDYMGEIHSDEREDSDYDLSLYRYPTGESVGIDASVRGNEARFVNDYRGVQAKPNAAFRDSRTESGQLRMGVWSIGEIKKGTEIVVSYGKAWWHARRSEPSGNDPEGWVAE